MMDVRHNRILEFRSDPRIEYLLDGNPVRAAVLNFDTARMRARWRELRVMKLESLTLHRSFGRAVGVGELLLPSLRTLAATGVNLTGSLPSEVATMSNMEELNVNLNIAHFSPV